MTRRSDTTRFIISIIAIAIITVLTVNAVIFLVEAIVP